MAMTHGRLTYFKINSIDLSPWTDTSDYNDEADLHETTTYGKSAKTYAPGLLNRSISLGGLYDAAAAAIEATMRPLVGAAATAFEFGPEGNSPTKKKISGSALVKSFKTSQPVGGMVRWTAEVQVTDAHTVGVFP
jgi:hypothetical protein